MKAAGRAPILRRLAAPTAVGVVLTAATGYLAAVDPAQPGHYPGCPILAVTGWYCPGCGGLRAIHALTQADLAGALSSNVVVTLAVPLAVILWIRWFLRAARPANSPGTAGDPTHRPGAPTSLRMPDDHRPSAQPGAPDQAPGQRAPLPGPAPSLIRTNTPGPHPKVPLPLGIRVWAPAGVALGLILFAVLRNLPGLEMLAP